MIIGSPKDLSGFLPFSSVEIDELVSGATEAATSGVPLNLPAGVELMQLVRMAKTLDDNRNVLRDMVSLRSSLEDEDGDSTAILDMMESIIEKADALLSIEPPKPPPLAKAPTVTKAGLIIP